MAAHERVVKGHTPHLLEVALWFYPKLWARRPVATEQQFHFLVTWQEWGQKASIDLISCKEREPRWSQGERSCVLGLLEEAIMEQTRRKVSHFDTTYIVWGE